MKNLNSFEPSSLPLPPVRQIDIELARRYLAKFCEFTTNLELHSWQILLCARLEKLSYQTGQRLLIHGPPQFGKSIVLSKRFPAWLLGVCPDLRIISAGYNVTHATSFTETVRNVMQSDEYAEIFPSADVRIKTVASAEKFSTALRESHNDSQPSVAAVGLLSGFTGRGADLLIIDDPYASPDDARSEAVNEKVWRFWDEISKVRLPESTNVVVMFHRYHEEDLAGRLERTGKWELMRFPAIADGQPGDPTGREIGEPLSPIRSIEWLREQEADNPHVFASQFQGTPLPSTGRLFDTGAFKIISERPRLKRWVRYWDLATTVRQSGDWTAGALVGVKEDGTIVIADMKRWRREWPDTRDGIRDDWGNVIEPGIVDVVAADMEAVRYDVDPYGEVTQGKLSCGIEGQGMQLALVQDLQRNALFLKIPLYPGPAKGDKKQRASVWAARGKAGKVEIVKGDWNAAFIQECKVFDGLGLAHDDQVDCVSGAVEMIYSTRGGEIEQPKTYQPGTPGYYKQIAKQLSR